MRVALSLSGLLVVLGLGCVGDPGPQGQPGPPGAPGPVGPPFTPPACGSLDGGSPGVGDVVLTISSPNNGQFFTVGEQPVVTMKVTDARCSSLLQPSALGTVQLYLAGPRQTLAVQTALRLLNAVGDRSVSQHHYVDLAAPSYADPSQNNLSIAADGTMTYRLAPVSTEAPGTYTVGLWVKSQDQLEQFFPLQDIQIGTVTAEQFASGSAEGSSCLSCHLGAANGKVYMHHIEPGFAPLGDFALDSAPIGTCNLCHNNDGYSPNPTVRKVHGVHRGEHQLAPGVAHPDYGLAADASLASYTDVGFPVLPADSPVVSTTAMEKDCASCHTDDRWQTRPSRVACGTCHDNVFFDTGTLSPPRVFGPPSGGACTSSGQCSAFGTYAVCNTGTGSCERQTHPEQPDDAQCATCHGPTNGVSPIADRHAIPLYTAARGIRVTVTSVSGGSEPSGVFKPGDKPIISFKLSDRGGNNIPDMLTNANLAGSALAAGPNSDPRRVYGTATGALTMTKGTLLTYDAGSETYTFTYPTPWPANNITPLNNSDPSLIRPNPAGPYTLYIYVAETLQPSGARDASGAVTTVKFVPTAGGASGFDGVARDVITQAACDACHVKTQAHGGGRADPQGCFNCHNPGGMDRTVGATGIACGVPTDCPGNNANPALSWETCNAGRCTITQDPTPNQTVDFGPMIHSIHFARLLDGYAERNNLVTPGLQIVGFNNVANDFSHILFPQDVRNCTTCHADTGASCSSAPCGFGQTCTAGKCANTAWLTPSTRVCVSCHDSGVAYQHAASNTLVKNGTTIETCSICHDPDGIEAVAQVHNISSPYVPPYPREKE
jgi:hypothetical protein